MPNIRIFNIKYDTDGENVPGLPAELFYDADTDNIDEIEDELGDFISDTTGWCHLGFETEMAKEA
jgi:hypothetical protein